MAAIPARFALERHAWQEAAMLEPRGSQFPQAEAIIYFARAMGSARGGDLTAAESELATLKDLRTNRLRMGEKKTDSKPSITPVKKVVGRPFPKGVSGNPGGQSRSAKAVIELARQACPSAILRLQAIVEDPDANPIAQVAAARELMDRGFGQAPMATLNLAVDAASMDVDGTGLSALLRRARIENEKHQTNILSSALCL